ncbi:MAG: Fic family protein, partial [Microbacterium sp.]|nr:Fic family protein [Microbacterium sp.]
DAVREVANYAKALSWGIGQMEHRTVTTSFIKELHALLLDGVVAYRHERGALRTMQAIVGTPGRSIDHARFIPPPPHDLPGLLLDLQRFIAEPGDVPPLVCLALTHYQFETIHPFPDGNGRVGRMLIPMLMRAWGIMRLPHVDFSAYVAPRRALYLDLLQHISQRGEWRPWIVFVLEGLEHQGATTLRIARDLLSLRDHLAAIFRDDLRLRQPVATADHLIEHASITSSQLGTLNQVSPATAHRQIAALVKRGIVREATGRQRDRVYVADIVLNVFQSTE